MRLSQHIVACAFIAVIVTFGVAVTSAVDIETPESILAPNAPPHMVQFHSPWCGNCRRMQGAWDSLGDRVDGVPVVQIDCTKHRNFCRAQEIAGYPTIRLYVPGHSSSPFAYQRQRTESELRDFLQRMKPFTDVALENAAKTTSTAPDTPETSCKQIRRLMRRAYTADGCEILLQGHGTVVACQIPHESLVYAAIGRQIDDGNDTIQKRLTVIADILDIHSDTYPSLLRESNGIMYVELPTVSLGTLLCV